MKNEVLGWMTERELRAIESIAKAVPDSGTVVEVGSMFGRSSVCWATCCDPSVNIFCIDLFYDTFTNHHSISEHDCLVNNYPLSGVYYPLKDMFTENTHSFDNIHPIQAHSPYQLEFPHSEIDVFFLDAAHTNPNDWDNIKFFAPLVKVSGILCGHDYSPEFKDVLENVQRLEEIVQCEATIIPTTSIWYFKLDKKITPEMLA